MRICLTCKLSKTSRESDVGADIIVGKPKKVEKVISVGHDAKSGQYSGLPTLWRELLDMPLSHSKNEVNTSKMDAVVAPALPNKRI